MKAYHKSILVACVALLPQALRAQGAAENIHDLQNVLDDVYDKTMPLCEQMINIGRGLAAFAAIWAISSKVWPSIARAEPIDFYPMLRPFAIGIAIAMFPQIISMMNGVLKPTVIGTEAMLEKSNSAVAVLLQRKEEAIKKTAAYSLLGPDAGWREFLAVEGAYAAIDPLNAGINFMAVRAAYNIKIQIKQWLSEVLQMLYEAAALCIDTVRIFYLIVLAIIGPITFGLAVFDSFQNSLVAWFVRYINVFLWLPVANILSTILGRLQENMIALDLEQIQQNGDTVFGAHDAAYIIFLIIGIVAYLFVPTIANYIIHAGDSKLAYGATTAFYSSAKATIVGGAKIAGAAYKSYKGGNSGSGNAESQGGALPNWSSMAGPPPAAGNSGGNGYDHGGAHRGGGYNNFNAYSGGDNSNGNGGSSSDPYPGGIGRNDSANANWQRDRYSKS